jgi:short-subunit dehydrogenase
MDVTSKESWEKFAAEVATPFKPDILINNAGMIHPFKNIIELTDAEVEKTIKTNYLSVVTATRIMIPILQQSATPGYVNVASASALLPVGGQAIYSSTKAALYAMSEVIRQEYMGQGWYVGYVLPGPVKTDLYKNKDSADGELKVKDKLVSNFGISSKAAARIILRRMSLKRGRILVGGISRLMGWTHSAIPGTSIWIMGKIGRMLPLATFKEVFSGEKEIRAKRKAQKKELKN